jgi:hypothetical protein
MTSACRTTRICPDDAKVDFKIANQKEVAETVSLHLSAGPKHYTSLTAKWNLNLPLA